MDAERRPSLLDGYLTEAEVAREFNVHTRTLQKWRYAGLGPRFVRKARQVLYSADDCREWLKSGGLNPSRARKTKRKS